MAGRGLAWWAIGASIIASNISAEQFVGMSGSGYAIGLAMATYEWIAALGLLFVAKFFIPTNCSAEIFEAIIEAPIAHQASPLPAKKYPFALCVSFLFLRETKSPTNKINKQ